MRSVYVVIVTVFGYRRFEIRLSDDPSKIRQTTDNNWSCVVWYCGWYSQCTAYHPPRPKHTYHETVVPVHSSWVYATYYLYYLFSYSLLFPSVRYDPITPLSIASYHWLHRHRIIVRIVSSTIIRTIDRIIIDSYRIAQSSTRIVSRHHRFVLLSSIAFQFPISLHRIESSSIVSHHHRSYRIIDRTIT